MVAAWIGKGAVTPFCASLRTIPSGRPREPKVIAGVSGADSTLVSATVSATVSTVVSAVSTSWVPSVSASMFSLFSGTTT